MATASNYIGESLKLNNGGTAIVGQIDYDWAFSVPHWWANDSTYTEFGVGYVDSVTQVYSTLNGAWGAWNSGQTLPTVVDLRDYTVKAGTAAEIYSVTGWGWNAIDEGLTAGSESAQFGGDLDAWNAAIDYIDKKVSWIWGDLRSGGCGFIKYDSTHVFILSTYGVYTSQDGQEKIAATATNTTYTIGELYGGCFAVFYWVSHDSYSHVGYVFPDTSMYLIQNPEQTLGNIDWTGSDHYASMSYSLDNSMSKFGDGRVYNTMFSMNSITSPYGSYNDWYIPGTVIDDPDYALSWGGDDTGLVDKMGNGGDAGDNDGDGDYNNNSDEIPLTTDDQFTIDAQSCGFITVFKPSKSTLQDFASWLYGDLITNYGSFLDNLNKLQSNPMDAIISLNMAHFDATTSGSEPMNFFGQASGFSAPVVSKLTHTLDCGSVTISEYSGNFLDYNNLSKIQIYLPYCGGPFSLSTNEVMGATLHLQYVIDVLSGSCVAELKVIRQRGRVYADPNLSATIYHFNGNIFQQVPISSVNYTNMVMGQLGQIAGAASIAGGAATGNIGAITGGISSIINGATASPSVEKIGGAGGNYGYLSTQKPFIIQEYPWYNWFDQYDNYNGRPLYDYKKLDYCDGYTEIDQSTLWTDKFDFITKEEEDMLISIFNSGGVYIDHSSEYYNYEP